MARNQRRGAPRRGIDARRASRNLAAMHGALHDLLAHAYHLGLRVLASPLWRAPAAALGVGLALRFALRGRGALAAALTLAAAWAVPLLPGLLPVLRAPLGRLPVAALVLAAATLPPPARGFLGTRLRAVALALGLAWWLRGAPVGGADLASVVPVFLLIWPGLALARRLTAADRGAAALAGAVSLAVALGLSGAAPHWARAALGPAWAALALMGMAEAAPMLAAGTVVAAAACLIASDRGRLLPVDVAALAPFATWGLAPVLLPWLRRAGPATAAALAGLASLALVGGLAALLR